MVYICLHLVDIHEMLYATGYYFLSQHLLSPFSVAVAKMILESETGRIQESREVKTLCDS